jgi:hypothetical protein
MKHDSDAEISSHGMFENLSFVKMESSKLINSLTNLSQSGQGTTVVFHLIFSNFLC